MRYLQHFIYALAGCSLSFAGETTTPSMELADDSKGWSYQINSYGWLSGNTGTSGFPNVADAVEVDDSFSDILEDLEFAFFVFGEARRDKWRYFIDFQYVDLSAKGNFGDVADVSLNTTQIRTQLGVGYEIYKNHSTSVFLNASAIYSYVNNELDTPGEDRELSENWIDPTIGLSLTHQFSDKWNGEVSLEYGGFTIASDEVVQSIAAVGYQFTPSWRGVVGYRYQSFDYSDDGFVYDLETQGPFLGVSYTF